MKFITSSLFIFFVSLTSFAQYTTPDTGVDWTLDDIATNSPGTVSVSGSVYTLLEDLTVAESDALTIDADITLEIEADVRVTVFGSFTVSGDDVLITAVEQNSPYEGFRFEEFSTIDIQNATIEYGGGLQVLTETFTLNNCIIQHNVSGTASGASVTMSRGVPIITNNEFLFNDMPALSSGANQNVSPYIFNNHIEGNNQANENRPQINLAATMPLDTLKIIQNTIIGDPNMTEAGGIAVANLFGNDVFAVIKDNTIRDNRYGLSVYGPTNYVLIENNVIEDNNTQNEPMLGGSGINLIAPGGNMEDVIVTKNQIRGNLWGITLQNEASANFGDDDENSGRNVFSENGNGGETYALFNNTPNTLTAKHNCWVEDGEGTIEEAEGVISHVEDDPSLGEVIFDPINCEELGTNELATINVALYPNPSTGILNIESEMTFESVQFFNLNGQLVFEQNIEGQTKLNFNLPKGLYFVTLQTATNSFTQKLIVE